MTTFQIGDKVQINTPTKGLEADKVYTIRDINRGIDGAYDWDEIYLEGFTQHFCEFNFNPAKEEPSAQFLLERIRLNLNSIINDIRLTAYGRDNNNRLRATIHEQLNELEKML